MAGSELPLHVRFRKVTFEADRFGNNIPTYGADDLLVIHAPDFHGPDWKTSAFTELDTVAQLTAERMAWVFGHPIAVFYGDDDVHTYTTGTFRSYSDGDHRRMAVAS